MLLSKTVVGLAFDNIDDRYRVGFTNIYNNAWAASSASYQVIGDFDVTQKTAFYNVLYSQSPSGNTPLQQAVDNVGKLFKKTAGCFY